MADTFHQLPSVVAAEMDEDAEGLNLRCVRLLNYAEAKRIFDSAKDKTKLAPYRGTVMDQVIDNTFRRHRRAYGMREED